MRDHFPPRHRWLRTILSVMTILLASGAVAVAQERTNERPRLKDATETQRAVDSRAITADAPNARLVALVRAPDGVLVASKGVASVQRISRGVYCIRPTNASGINPLTAVAVVSVEYFYSLFSEVKVQWARRQNGCGNNRIGVYTLADPNLTARYTFSNAVGFVVYVP